MAEEPEVEPGATPVEETQPSTPGAKLRAAREAQGLSLQDVATRTRIAQRQLEAVERGDLDEECLGLLDAVKRLNEINRRLRNLIATNVQNRLSALTGSGQAYAAAPRAAYRAAHA